MRFKLKLQTLGPSLLSIAVAFLNACGETKSDSTSSGPSCPSTTTSTAGGYVLCLGTATTSTITLAGDSSQQYVVAPYTLGDMSTVTGASDTKLSFNMTATSASLQSLHSDKPALGLTSDATPGETMRLILNHFDRRKGMDQPEWMWPTLKGLDASAGHQSRLTKHFTHLINEKFAPTAKQPLTLGNCPTSIPKVDNSASTFSASTNYDGTSFCMVYASDPVSETKTNLQKSVASILSYYKDTIYGDQFTTNVANGYSFNPVIVVVDPTDNSMWPKGNSAYNFVGAFSKDATTAAKRPIIYIVDNVPSVQSGTSTEKSTRLMHATLAHEMQHAIMDYYRNRGTTTKEETVAVDEGIAHTFEDMFGYGADNFTSFAQAFLSGVPDGNPVMVTGTGYNKNAARGGANAFLYFLAVRAGGFTVTSNRPFSGAGLTAITNLVKQTTANGPTAIQTAFGSTNLTEQVGQFFGAIYTDNLSLSFAPAIFTGAQYDNIADLQGNTNKTFGVRFNNFGGTGGITTVGTSKLSDASAGFDLKHYATNPVLITPSAATATVTITFPASSNNGVAVVRVK